MRALRARDAAPGLLHARAKANPDGEPEHAANRLRRAFLLDLYGEQQVLRDGVVPPN